MRGPWGRASSTTEVTCQLIKSEQNMSSEFKPFEPYVVQRPYSVLCLVYIQKTDSGSTCRWASTVLAPPYIAFCSFSQVSKHKGLENADDDDKHDNLGKYWMRRTIVLISLTQRYETNNYCESFQEEDQSHRVCESNDVTNNQSTVKSIYSQKLRCFSGTWDYPQILGWPR